MEEIINFEKDLRSTFKEDSLQHYLYSDAMFIRNESDWHPEKQWIYILGNIIKETNTYRYFNKNMENIAIPAHTCYDKFYIYDHKYPQNKTMEIVWRDLKFFKNGYQNDQLDKIYLHTKGVIVRETNSHVLFLVETHLTKVKNHEKFYKDFKYLSIPKSYIFKN